MSVTQGNDTDLLIDRLRELLAAYEPINSGQQLNPIDAFFAYRLLLGRNPDPFGELPRILSETGTLRDYLSRLLDSDEYRGIGRFFPAGHLLMAEVEGFRFWFNTSDREMGVLMALGVYEPKTVRLLRQLVTPGTRAVDVGAQTGFYTCLMASLAGADGHVTAVEPMPASFDLLERNVHENGFEGRVTRFRAAASNERSTVQAAVLSNMYVVGAADGTDRVAVDSIRLDDAVDGPMDLVKIDIEGHEPAAIEGMRSIITRDRPIILSEVNEYWLRSCSASSGSAYVNLLSSLGYDVYNVDDLRRPLLGSALHLADLETIDVIAVPAGQPVPVA